MFLLSSVVVVAASLQVITSQGPPDIPPQCRVPPPGVERPADCCKIPQLFEAEDFKDCGFEMKGNGEGPIIPAHAPPPHDCTKQQCLLEKKKLLKDGEIDKAAASALLDQWAETNTDFKPTIESVKERCIQNEIPGPPHMCAETKLLFCVGMTLFSECPVWEETDECKALKDHMQECAPHFKKH
ncbi:hypothetical protein O0L34_g5334 [Tuta absoluta]|nr:hypothetical protein O0L34_g5334 [Tuta absoluta]